MQRKVKVKISIPLLESLLHLPSSHRITNIEDEVDDQWKNIITFTIEGDSLPESEIGSEPPYATIIAEKIELKFELVK